MYTLKQVKDDIRDKEPFGSGHEGDAYRLDSGLVAKVNRRRPPTFVGVGEGPSYFKILPRTLAEYRRQAVHHAMGAILKSHPLFVEGWGVELVDILQTFVDKGDSISVMPYVEGRTASLLSKDTPSLRRVEYMLNLRGVRLDIQLEIPEEQNENILYTPDGRVVVLETNGDLHPEILKCAEYVGDPSTVLRHVARANLLGATDDYPTVSCDTGDGPISSEDFFRDYLEVCEMVAVEGSLEVERAKSVFGKQFHPERFDWEHGSNLALYGIRQDIFDELKQQEKSLQKEVDELREEIKKWLPEDIKTLLAETPSKFKLF